MERGIIMMTRKQLIELASNPEIMDYLNDIANIQSGMPYKTEHERKTAKREMDKYAIYIINMLNKI